MNSRASPRSASFDGGIPTMSIVRSESHPDLRHRLEVSTSPESGKRLTKLLVNVTVERSPGPVHVVISPEKAVADLIAAAVAAYVKEGRRPLLSRTDPKGFKLYYSQYSLERIL